MQKKLLAVAVAGALVSGSAFAQTSVTISGALNLWWESVRATGATANFGAVNADSLSRDRISDGAGSNIRFTVVEDIGGGMQAFGQVESAVFANADTRNNAFGAGAGTTGWGNRNSGVGLRSKAWGEILMGVWDVHYNEHYAADGGLLKGTSSSNSLGLLNTFGTGTPAIGGRYNNVIRYASPSWSGFSFRAVYARPTDTAPTNAAGSVNHGKKNRVLNFAPSYSAGPIFVGYTHLTDKDVANAANATLGIPAGNSKIRSDRLSAAYTFPMGIKIGFIYDRAKWSISTAAGSGDLKRDVWTLPLSYTAGPHALHFQYSRAKDWKGSAVTGTAITVGTNPQTFSATGDSGARMYSLVYQYDLSKRTNLHLSFANIRNEALAAYDFFAAGVGGVAAGADPRQFGIGLRHAF